MSRVQTLYELQMIGTAVFAVTGVLAVNRRGLDVFGGIVLGTVTSLGGGTIRDRRHPRAGLLAGGHELSAGRRGRVAGGVLYQPASSRPPILSSSTSTLSAPRSSASRPTEKVLGLQFGPLIAVSMGMLTGIGGGLLRDVLARQTDIAHVPRDLCDANPSWLPALRRAQEHRIRERPILTVAIGFIFCMRAAAIHWHLQMPVWLTNRDDLA